LPMRSRNPWRSSVQ